MEIPETVWADAKALVGDFGKDDPHVYREAFCEIEARAIMAERERCINIAEMAPSIMITTSEGAYAAARHISQAIRYPHGR